MAMDLPVSDPGPVKDGGAPYCCGHCDTELVHKLAQLLLPGLATACVDNTIGDPFNRPASVAVAARSDLLDFLSARSESFVADSLAAPSDPPPSDDPADILSSLLDDFADSKRSLLARVSGWLLSDSREDKIDDFVQEMDANRFWPLDRREAAVESLLRNIDYKNAHHCAAGFDTPEQLDEHRRSCGLRPVACGSDGCKARFAAARAEAHAASCPYQVVPCEQGCGESLVRREMDRHCITVCPMRLVNCPFFQVGCQSAFPRCTLERHCTEFLSSHLMCVLQVIHKHEASVDELKQRVQLLEKSQSLSELSEALDVRSLTLAVKEQEAKMKKLEHGLSNLSEARS